MSDLEGSPPPFATFEQIASQPARVAAALTPGRPLTRDEKLRKKRKGAEVVSLSPPPNPFEVSAPARHASSASRLPNVDRSPVRMEAQQVGAERMPNSSPRQHSGATEQTEGASRSKRRRLMDGEDESAFAPVQKRANASSQQRSQRAHDEMDKVSASDHRLPSPALGAVQSPPRKSVKAPQTIKRDTEQKAKSKEPASKPANDEAPPKPKKRPVADGPAKKMKTTEKASKKAKTDGGDALPMSVANKIWETLLAAAEAAPESDGLTEFVRLGQRRFTVLDSLALCRRERETLQAKVDKLQAKHRGIQEQTRQEEELWQRSRLRTQLLGELNVALLEHQTSDTAEQPTATSLQYQLGRRDAMMS